VQPSLAGKLHKHCSPRIFCLRSVGQSRVPFANRHQIYLKYGISVAGMVRMPCKYCKCPVELFRDYQAGKLVGQRHGSERKRSLR
jgi:hypothetical protein